MEVTRDIHSKEQITRSLVITDTSKPHIKIHTRIFNVREITDNILETNDEGEEVYVEKIVEWIYDKSVSEVDSEIYLLQALFGKKEISTPLILAFQRLIGKQLTDMTDKMEESEIIEYADLYPTWKPSGIYKLNSIYSYGVNQDDETQLWKCTIEHNYDHHVYESPEVVPALWKKIGFTEEGYPIWTQPLGVHDSYQIGDRVSFEGHIYECNTANNTWSPTTYGWTLIE